MWWNEHILVPSKEYGSFFFCLDYVEPHQGTVYIHTHTHIYIGTPCDWWQ